MKPIRGIALILAFSPALAQAQNSSVLKSASKYLPSLTEIGFVTGAINTYVQTATLVRAVNKEIALAKSMSKRLDDLQNETEEMLGRFGSLTQINPYNMDSWAAWLDRAQGLATEETSDFIDILFNSVLKTIDDRMTVGFYSNVRKGLSYDASQGQVGDVLRAYYMNREYEFNRDKIRKAAVNTRKVMLLMNQKELAEMREALKKEMPAGLKKVLEFRASMLESQITSLENQISDPAVGGTSTDRQIEFLNDLARNLGEEIASSGMKIEQHQKDLTALNREWELAAKDKLPKSKNRTVRPTGTGFRRPIYDERNPDKVPSPVNDVDKPLKQNTSETSTATSLSDLLHIQNKVEFKKLEMAETLLSMDLSIAQGRAALLSIHAYEYEIERNLRTDALFGIENLHHFLRE
jgi:hypothetical protein